MTDVTMRSVDNHDDLRRLGQAVEALDEEFRELEAMVAIEPPPLSPSRHGVALEEESVTHPTGPDDS